MAWRHNVKMSQKRDKTVPQLVEKYRREFPELEKRFIRRLIIAEHKELFTIDSEVRKLTRYLEKSFKSNDKKTKDSELCSQKPLDKLGFFERRAEQIRIAEKEQKRLNLVDAREYAKLVAKFYPDECSSFKDLAEFYDQKLKNLNKKEKD
jgi:hypothetical protein